MLKIALNVKWLDIPCIRRLHYQGWALGNVLMATSSCYLFLERLNNFFQWLLAKILLILEMIPSFWLCIWIFFIVFDSLNVWMLVAEGGFITRASKCPNGHLPTSHCFKPFWEHYGRSQMATSNENVILVSLHRCGKWLKQTLLMYWKTKTTENLYIIDALA